MSKPIQAYQTRVLLEKADLDGKISSLSFFLISKSGDVDKAELDRLDVQLRIMRAYSGILKARIEAFAS